MSATADQSTWVGHYLLEEGPVINKLKLLTSQKIYGHSNPNLDIIIEECGVPSIPSKPSKVLLLVGATGSGKTTWINRLANHLMGVRYDDDTRYVLIEEEKKSQADSQTQKVTVYKFNQFLDYTLTVIDTPGFGDSEGPEKERLTVAQIQEVFLPGRHGIDEIHGIGLVVNASLARLDTAQKHVLQSIFTIFGKDIEENIFVISTHDDMEEEPKALAAIRKAQISCTKIFQFNNHQLYRQRKTPLSKTHWEGTSESFNEFLSSFKHIQGISLEQTNEVLRERSVLEDILKSLNCQMRSIVAKIDEKEVWKETHFNLSREAKKRRRSRSLVEKIRENPAPAGRNVTSCRKCQYTCHNKCWCDTRKYWCNRINILGHCRVCPGKCSYKEHISGVIYKQDFEKKEIQCNEEEKVDAEIRIANIDEEQKVLRKKMKKITKDARECLQKINKIALRPNPLTDTEYIDLLIEQEKSEHGVGWETRIAHYTELKRDIGLIDGAGDDKGSVLEISLQNQNLEDICELHIPLQNLDETQC